MPEGEQTRLGSDGQGTTVGEPGKAAMRDGELVDVSDLAARAGFEVPVALTAEVWADVVAWNPRNLKALDQRGRLWTVLVEARRAHSLRHSQAAFTVNRVPNRPDARQAETVTLTKVTSTDTKGGTVVTITTPAAA